jgi:putative membrane protein
MTTLTTLAKVDKTRDHLANERTFLAWIRTSISIIVFGFVVAKFGITLREFLLLQTHTAKESGISLYIGVGFMVMGVFMSLISVIRYRITMQRIETDQFKPTSLIVVLLGMVTAFFGAILVLYLILTAQTVP